MNLLLDTHILLWLALNDDLMSAEADALVKDLDNTLWFSAASLWEVSIKNSLNRPDFRVDPGALRAGLVNNGYRELAVEGRHCLLLGTLPPIHGDPFDRMLLSQAIAEGLQLVTADQKLAAYEGPILKV